MPANRREPSIPTTIRLPASVYYELRTLMCDPRTGEIRYATWGALFESLARAWLDKQKIAATPDTLADLPAREKLARLKHKLRTY